MYSITYINVNFIESQKKKKHVKQIKIGHYSEIDIE